MGTATGSNTVEALDAVEPPGGLWLLAIVFFGVGDLVTTILGLTVGSSTEANPIVAMFVERYGVAVLPLLKVVFLGCCYVGWKRLPIPYPIVIPAVLAVLGIVVTLWNASVLLT